MEVELKSVSRLHHSNEPSWPLQAVPKEGHRPAPLPRVRTPTFVPYIGVPMGSDAE